MTTWNCPACGQTSIVPDGASTDRLCPACQAQHRPDVIATVSTASCDLPREFSKYVLLEKVGSGGTANVFMARDTSLDRIVAVKIPHAGILLSRDEKMRFLRESKAVAQLKHVGIVSVYDVGYVDGIPYLATEFVHGCNLSDLIANQILEFRDIGLLVEEIAAALSHAHFKGIIHRDVKPSNIMVGLDGKPRLMDFGLAKNLGGEPTITADGQILGTPAFMSPEQADGRGRSVDERSDVYSLGAVLYTLLVRRPPFEGEFRWMLHQAIHDEPRPPRQLDPSVPKDLETICLKAMSKNPDHRFRSVEELKAELERYRNEEKIETLPLSRVERAWRWSQRHPLVAALGAAVFCLLFTIAIGSTVTAISFRALATQESLARQQAEQALEHNRRMLVSMHVSQGSNHLAEGRMMDSLPWFHEAMRIDTADRQPLHQLRMSLLLQQAPKPLQAWRFPAGCAAAEPSPDGTQVVIATRDGTAQTFDATSGAPVSGVIKHLSTVRKVRFCRDGSRVLSLAWEKAGRGSRSEIQVWNPLTGLPIRVPVQLDANVTCAEIAPDGQTLLAVVAGKVQVWRSEGEESPILCLDTDPVTLALFCPDNTKIMTAGRDGVVSLWDAKSGKKLGDSMINPSSVTRAAFSPDGKYLALACGALGKTSATRVWNVDSMAPQTPILGHRDAVTALSFSPDGQRVLTASRDGSTQIWATEDGQPIGPAIQHELPVTHAVFSPDGEQILTIAAKPMGMARLHLWDADTGSASIPAVKLEGSVTAAAFFHDQTRALVASLEGTAWVWNLVIEKGKPLLPQRLLTDGESVIDYQNGRILGMLPKSRIALWDLGNGGRPREMEAPLERVSWVALAPVGPWAALGSGDGRGLIVDLEAKQVVAQIKTSPDVYRVSFSPSGQWLAALTLSGQLQIWDRETGALRELTAEGSSMCAFAFAPKQAMVLTAGGDQRIRTWDLRNGLPIASAEIGSLTERMEYAQDGESFVTASQDGTARVWSTHPKLKCVRQLRHGSMLTFARYSPDGRRLVTASIDGFVRLWDTATGRLISGPLVHRSALLNVSFSDDSQLLASASVDGEARVWSAESAEPISPVLRHSRAVTRLEFLKDRHDVIAVCRDGQIQKWNLDSAPVLRSNMQREVSLLSGYVIDDSGTAVDHSSDSRFQDFGEVYRAGSHSLLSTAEQRRAWHVDRARSFLIQENWPASLFHWNHAITIAADAKSLESRGHVHANLHQWSHAATDFAGAVHHHAEEPSVWRFAALTALVANDRAGYEQICQSMCDNFGASDDISTILMTARTCTLAPNKIAQSGLPAKMVGKVLKLAPEDRFASAIHAAALYRAGDWENAVSVASIEGKQPSLAIGDDLLAQTLPAFRSVIGAMAAYQGGSPAALGKLKLGAEISSIVEDSMENCPWPMQAELTILRSEVDSMIQAQPK